MGMMVRFAIHPLPDGWEELVPRDILTDERVFDRWIAQDLDARLAQLTPPGFTPKRA